MLGHVAHCIMCIVVLGHVAHCIMCIVVLGHVAHCIRRIAVHCCVRACGPPYYVHYCARACGFYIAWNVGLWHGGISLSWLCYGMQPSLAGLFIRACGPPC